MPIETITVRLTIDTDLIHDIDDPEQYDAAPDLEGLIMSDYPFTDFDVIDLEAITKALAEAKAVAFMAIDRLRINNMNGEEDEYIEDCQTLIDMIEAAQ